MFLPALLLVAAAAGPGTSVVIDSTQPQVELFEHVDYGHLGYPGGRIGFTREQRLCRAPCRARLVDARGDFYVGGDGVVESEKFSLAGVGPDVLVRVDAGSSGLRGLGKFALIGGCAATGIGALLSLYGLTVYDGYGGADFMRVGGPMLMLVGIAAVVTGIVMLVRHQTHVYVEPNPAPPREDLNVLPQAPATPFGEEPRSGETPATM